MWWFVLKELYRTLYGNEVTRADLTDLGRRLALVAGKQNPYSYRYMRSLYYHDAGFEQPGAKLAIAIGKLLAAVDSQHLSLATVEPTHVTAVGHVAPGSLILGDSRRCAYPPCAVNFVPRAWNGKYCCHEHGRLAKKLRRQNEKMSNMWQKTTGS